MNDIAAIIIQFFKFLSTHSRIFLNNIKVLPDKFMFPYIYRFVSIILIPTSFTQLPFSTLSSLQ